MQSASIHQGDQNDKTFHAGWPLRTSALGLSLAFAAAMTACTSSAPPPADSLTLEQMIRLPVEKDREGMIELGNYLRDLYGVSHDQPLAPENNGHLEKMPLPDGNAISEGFVSHNDDNGKDYVTFLVDPTPCVDIRTSTGWIGATLVGNTTGGRVLYGLQKTSLRVALISNDGKCLSMVTIDTR